MILIYRDFEVVQSGRTLTCNEGKIVINKYDTRTQRIHFTFDELVEGSRLYVSLNNPVLNRYFISPIVDGYYEITSLISVYPGRWEMIVIGVDDAYEITDDTIDQSKATYVSDTYKKLVVKDNFLDEESKDAIDPVQNAAIDAALDNLEKNRLVLEAMADGAVQAAAEAKASEERCNEVADMIEQLEMLEDMEAGKRLSTNDFTNTYKNKLDNIEENAQVNVIESISVNGVNRPIVNKNVDITVPTRLSELQNNADYVVDASYIHTDNNFTNEEKVRLANTVSQSELEDAIAQIQTISFYICGNGEYDVVTKVPTIQSPDENTFYLVPNGGNSGNVFDEYIYRNGWELIGGANIDTSNFMDENDVISNAEIDDIFDESDDPIVDVGQVDHMVLG